MHVLTAEQPDPSTLGAALARARAEFLEMPGLQLTPAQASRLWALDDVLCHAVLEALVDARFLIRSGRSAFSRA